MHGKLKHLASGKKSPKLHCDHGFLSAVVGSEPRCCLVRESHQKGLFHVAVPMAKGHTEHLCQCRAELAQLLLYLLTAMDSEPVCPILCASLFLAHQSRENSPDHRVLLFPVPWRRQRCYIDAFMWDSHRSVRPRGETSATALGRTISGVFK